MKITTNSSQNNTINASARRNLVLFQEYQSASNSSERNNSAQKIYNALRPLALRIATRMEKRNPLLDRDDLVNISIYKLLNDLKSQPANSVETSTATILCRAMIDYSRKFSTGGESESLHRKLNALENRLGDLAQTTGHSPSGEEVDDELRKLFNNPDNPNSKKLFSRIVSSLNGHVTRSLDSSITSSSNKPVSLKDLIPTYSGIDLDSCEDLPFPDCSFPPKDHLIYHTNLSRDEMVLIDLYFGLTGKISF
jgi:DNA-directed RNA polymerase specialized sigma subunit